MRTNVDLQFHAFLESRRFLPKETFPRRKVGSFEKSVLENAFDTCRERNDTNEVRDMAAKETRMDETTAQTYRQVPVIDEENRIC